MLGITCYHHSTRGDYGTKYGQFLYQSIAALISKNFRTENNFYITPGVFHIRCDYSIPIHISDERREK